MQSAEEVPIHYHYPRFVNIFCLTVT
jgi:hypothetical protein